MGFLFLLKHWLIFGDPNGPRLPDYAVEVCGSDALEDSQAGNQ